MRGQSASSDYMLTCLFTLWQPRSSPLRAFLFLTRFAYNLGLTFPLCAVFPASHEQRSNTVPSFDRM